MYCNYPYIPKLKRLRFCCSVVNEGVLPETLFEAYAVVHPGILTVVFGLGITISFVKSNRLGLPLARFQYTFITTHFRCPFFQFSKNPGRNTFSAVGGEGIHSFHFHATRTEFLNSS